MGVDEFFCHPPCAGRVLERDSRGDEMVLILLGGTCHADWGSGSQLIGKRQNVFGGLPYALYLPAGSHAKLRAETVCEIAECRVPSQARLKPKLVTPQDVASSLRGGENSSRQILRSSVRTSPPIALSSLRFTLQGATGRAILRINTMSTILPPKWISTRSITIESAILVDLLYRTSTTRGTPRM